MNDPAWPSTLLKRVVTSIESGTSVNGAALPASGGAPGVLKTSAVSGGMFNPHENKEVVDFDLTRVSCPVRSGTLIVSRMNTKQHIGLTAAVRREFPNLYLPDRLWQVTLSDKADARFIDWWTKTREYRAQVEALSVGTSSSMQNISQGDFLEFRVTLPPVDQQRLIAEFLDRETTRIDTLIAKQEQLIATLRERRSALISHAVAQNGVERVPLRRVAEVIDCAHVTADFVDDDEAYPVASIRECQGSVVDLSACKYTTEEFYTLLRAGGRAPRIGDLLFVRNVSVGLVSTVVQDTGEFAVGQETVLLRRSALVDPDFLRYSLMGSEVCHEIEARMIGSTFRRINVSAIRALPVPLPPIEDQQRIAARLDELTAKIDALISKTGEFIDLSKERRSALITAAVTGQLDVRGEVA